MKVAVIGHRNVKITKEVEEIIYTQIEALIKEGADRFYFAYNGAFANACYNAVTALRNKYQVYRVYYCDKNNVLAQFIKKGFDEEVVKNGRITDNLMIDDCDALLTFYDPGYVPYYSQSGKSGTYYAVQHANKKDKRIINITDLI